MRARRRDIVALGVYSVPTVGLFLQGLLYLTTPRFMPYHADALTLGLTALYAVGGLISQSPRRSDVRTQGHLS